MNRLLQGKLQCEITAHQLPSSNCPCAQTYPAVNTRKLLSQGKYGDLSQTECLESVHMALTTQ